MIRGWRAILTIAVDLKSRGLRRRAQEVVVDL